MRGGETCIWRGIWLEEGGVRASGVIAPEAKFAASEIDNLTGLLERGSFIIRAREKLQTPGAYELVVADLNRLRESVLRPSRDEHGRSALDVVSLPLLI